MRNEAEDKHLTAKALYGLLALAGAALLALYGLLLPTHDYAGLGDQVLDRVVSDDARDVAAMLATVSILLAGASITLIRFRRFPVVYTAILMLGIFNLVRLAPYY